MKKKKITKCLAFWGQVQCTKLKLNMSSDPLPERAAAARTRAGAGHGRLWQDAVLQAGRGCAVGGAGRAVLWLFGSSTNMSSSGRVVRAKCCYFMILSSSFNPQGSAQWFLNHKWLNPRRDEENFQKSPWPHTSLRTHEQLGGKKPLQVRSSWLLSLSSLSRLLPTSDSSG